jgi:isopenicillin N synthase-like dioxygenase
MDDGAAATKPRNLGGSLPVPNVQDLAARRDLTPAVLHRYLRDVVSSSVVDGDANATTACSVPVVDLGRLLDDGEHAAKLRSACDDWGFFHVINHGVPAKVVDDAKEDLKGFFQLPLAEKLAFAQEPGGIEGHGQAFVVSDEQKLDYSDMYYLSTQPPEYRDLKLWPSSSSSTFKDSLERYSSEVQRVATDLLRVMAKNLGVEDAEKLTRIAGSQSIRMNYYPPCPQAHDRVLGLPPHSDAVGLTLLLQVSPVPGLQIRRHGAWIPVAPIPGGLVANIGDVITNGRYKSIEHRAVVNAWHERVSMAAFHSGRFGETFGPLKEMLVGGGSEACYKTVAVEDYVKLVLSSKLDGKNIMDAMIPRRSLMIWIVSFLLFGGQN